MEKNNSHFSIFMHFVKRPAVLNSQLSTLNSQLIILLITWCCFSCNQHTPNPNRVQNPVRVETATTLLADSLSQSTGNVWIDSLLQLAAVTPPDTNLANIYYQIGDYYENNDPEKGKAFYLQMNILNEHLAWDKGRWLFASAFSIMLAREGLADSALVIVSKGLDLAKKENNERWISALSINTGTIYLVKGWYETALNYFMEAIPYLEHSNSQGQLGNLYENMTKVYRAINRLDKAVEYGEKAVALLEEYPNFSYALYELSVTCSRLQQYEKSNEYLLKALEISNQKNNVYSMVFIYYQLGLNALYVYDLDKVEMCLNKMVEICGSKDKMLNDMRYLMLLGKLEELKGNYAISESHIKQALEIATEREALEAKRLFYLILCELSVAQQKYRDNIRYWDEIDLLDIEISNNTTIQAIEENAAKYESEKKDFQIKTLKKERKLMVGLSITGGAVLLLASITFLLLWRWIVQKKRTIEQQKQLVEQQVRQLEQEKQLIATQAVLDGETQERTRLARDLHDGLGSMLTGAKLRLLEMKQGAKLEYADVERFDKALGLLDDSVFEMRRVAHHLMPDSLSRFGLKPAVGDYCSNLPSVKFAYYGDESRLEPKLEVMIYRSIHELVNNALKHACAHHIIVQIMQEADRIAFTVQDDGCGFDPSSITQGMGLQNIHTRVASYNGVIHIDSKIGEGTEINVELSI